MDAQEPYIERHLPGEPITCSFRVPESGRYVLRADVPITGTVWNTGFGTQSFDQFLSTLPLGWCFGGTELVLQIHERYSADVYYRVWLEKAAPVDTMETPLQSSGWVGSSIFLPLTAIPENSIPADPKWTLSDPELAALEPVPGGCVVHLKKPGIVAVTVTDPVTDYWCTTDVTITRPVDIMGTNMTLGNELSINFFVRQSDVTDGQRLSALIIQKHADGKPVDMTWIPFEQWETYNSLYKIPYDKITAKEMTDELEVAIYDMNEIPEVQAGHTHTDSIEGYMLRNLRDPKSKEHTRKLMVNTLFYGAAAQRQFGYGLTAPADRELTEAERALRHPPVAVQDHRIKGANYYGSNMTLGTSMTLNLFFKNVDPSMHAVVTFRKHNGKDMTATVTGDRFIKYKGNIYMIPVDTLVVADAWQPVTVKVYDSSDKLVGQATDSVESYVARLQNADEVTDAIMRFAACAYEYFHNR